MRGIEPRSIGTDLFIYYRKLGLYLGLFISSNKILLIDTYRVNELKYTLYLTDGCLLSVINA